MRPRDTTEVFTFSELVTATNNFSEECIIGEGGFGRVYKGKLEKTGQVVAVKEIEEKHGLKGDKKFLVEVLMLSLLHHPNLVTLIGYCPEEDKRVLVYEYMPLGSLQYHLFGNINHFKPNIYISFYKLTKKINSNRFTKPDIKPEQKLLDWNTRIKIALGIAKALEFIHHKAKALDLKPANILLTRNFDAKISNFGLAKLGPIGDTLHDSNREIGTPGYCAPEYEETGYLTVKSDVYSFGVVLLELITGKRVIDTTRPSDEHNLVTWAQPIFEDPSEFVQLVDPLVGGEYTEKSLNQAVAVAAMCIQEEPTVRPLMSNVVTALSTLKHPLRSYLDYVGHLEQECLELSYSDILRSPMQESRRGVLEGSTVMTQLIGNMVCNFHKTVGEKLSNDFKERMEKLVCDADDAST
ncbi:unnamed protein product [Cochlearia groenlandica]